MKATDVFKPQGVPTHTLIREYYDEESAEHSFDSNYHPDKIELFQDAIDEKGKLIRVVGPSKSGKTVFVKTLAENFEIVRVSASGIKSGSDLWVRILGSLGESFENQTSTQYSTTGGVEVVGKAEAGIFVAKVEAETKGKLEHARTKIAEKINYHDPINSIVKNLKESEVWIFIDDFHYASPEIQAELAEQIKHAAEEKVQIILALIPGRSEDILLKNDDLRGRTVDIKFTYWSIHDLKLIAEAGFPLLGIHIDPGSSELIATEAAGSPQLMQSICLMLARKFGARNAPVNPPTNFSINKEILTEICFKLSSSSFDYSETIDQMKKGPPTRGVQRKSYPDKNGKNRDVYQLIVKSFSVDPPKLKLTDTELESRVNNLAGCKVASIWESVRHISEIVNNMSQDIKIDFGGDKRWVTILDPYLFFALRWHEYDE